MGGNVCNASPAGDTLPALLAFDAQCKIIGPEGERWVPLDQVFKGPGSTLVQQGEILTELSLPPPAKNSGSLYIKHSPRGAMDISAVGVASVVSLRDGGRICDNLTRSTCQQGQRCRIRGWIDRFGKRDLKPDHRAIRSIRIERHFQYAAAGGNGSETAGPQQTTGFEL